MKLVFEVFFNESETDHQAAQLLHGRARLEKGVRRAITYLTDQVTAVDLNEVEAQDEPGI